MVAALGARVAKADEELEGLQENRPEASRGMKGVYYPRLSAMSLTLLVPDLLPLVPAPEAAALRLPALETWLARAQSRRDPGTGSRWLLAQWGLGEDAPVAALTLAADGGPR